MLCIAFRFIEDLTTINNESFEKIIRNIYPAGLELKKENQIDKSANFLDLNIYEKRENFDLNIVRMPYKSVIFHIRYFSQKYLQKCSEYASNNEILGLHKICYLNY